MIGLRASPSSTSIVCRDHPHHKSHPHPHPIAIHPSILPSIIITIIIINLPSVHPWRPTDRLYTRIHPSIRPLREGKEKKDPPVCKLTPQCRRSQGKNFFLFLPPLPPAPFFCLVLQRKYKSVIKWRENLGHSGRKVVGSESTGGLVG